MRIFMLPSSKPLRRDPRLRSYTLPDAVVGSITVLVILLAWEMAVRLDWISSFQFPPPSRLAQTFSNLLTVGFPRGVTAWIHIQATVLRILQGYVLATLLAIPIGLIIGRSRLMDIAISPVITFARSVATISLLPLAVAWFGVGEVTRVFLITYGCFWIILTNVIAGVKQVDIDYIRAAQTLATDSKQMFYRVILPASLPRIFSGMKVALGMAFLVIVAVEMIGTIEGLGALIQQSRTFYRSDMAMVGMVFMGIFGFALSKGLDWLEKLLLPWAVGLEEVER
jgi:ABC-type nitrate/sulfonate/bicarbonate transport system permease component